MGKKRKTKKFLQYYGKEYVEKHEEEKKCSRDSTDGEHRVQTRRLN